MKVEVENTQCDTKLQKIEIKGEKKEIKEHKCVSNQVADRSHNRKSKRVELNTTGVL